jgi:hypothetical protein
MLSASGPPEPPPERGLVALGIVTLARRAFRPTQVVVGRDGVRVQRSPGLPSELGTLRRPRVRRARSRGPLPSPAGRRRGRPALHAGCPGRPGAPHSRGPGPRRRRRGPRRRGARAPGPPPRRLARRPPRPPRRRGGLPHRLTHPRGPPRRPRGSLGGRAGTGAALTARDGAPGGQGGIRRRR